jgi:hypothetical protein
MSNSMEKDSDNPNLNPFPYLNPNLNPTAGLKAASCRHLEKKELPEIKTEKEIG